MTAELLLDLPEDEYHADPCQGPSLSSSIANILLSKSPAHAYMAHPKLGGQPVEATADMDDGTVLHKLLLGRGQQVCIIDADDFRTKVARELRDGAKAAGQLPMLRRKYDELIGAATFIRTNIKAHGFDLDTGCNEATFMWDEPSHYGAVRCRARLDHLNIKAGLIVDLKKSRSAHPKACERHVLDYGYHVARAAYTRAVEKKFPELTGRTSFVFLFIELAPPYAVTAAELGGVLRELGERQWDEAVGRWATCLRTGKWPAYSEQVIQLEAPPWVLRSEESAAE